MADRDQRRPAGDVLPQLVGQRIQRLVGILDHPDMPHSSSNFYIGRYAFIALLINRLNRIVDRTAFLNGQLSQDDVARLADSTLNVCGEFQLGLRVHKPPRGAPIL